MIPCHVKQICGIKPISVRMHLTFTAHHQGNLIYDIMCVFEMFVVKPFSSLQHEIKSCKCKMGKTG